MPCIHFAGGIVSYNLAYRFKGFYFEFHPYFGPTKLRKDGEIAKKQGKKFFEVFGEWFKLSKEEKEKTLV